MDLKQFNRRSLLRLSAAGGALTGVAGALQLILPSGSAAPVSPHADHERPLQHDGNPLTMNHAGHSLSATVGDVDVERMGFDPSVLVHTFDYGEATTMADGTAVREWEIAAFDKEIEIAPGVFFPAWTYNGQVPGPTLRANEGDRLRVHFTNAGSHPHTMHFHGIHSAAMDGVTGIGRGEIQLGRARSPTSSTARPFGCHLYHCHSTPLKRHIHKGLYGAFIVNPDPDKQGDAAKARHPDYAGVGGVAGVRHGDERLRHHLRRRERGLRGQHRRLPLHEAPDRDRPRRGRCASIWSTSPSSTRSTRSTSTPTSSTTTTPGTQLEPTLRTVDTIMQAQAQRGILEFSLPRTTSRASTCSTPTSRSSPSSAGWGPSMSASDRQSRTRRAARRPTRSTSPTSDRSRLHAAARSCWALVPLLLLAGGAGLDRAHRCRTGRPHRAADRNAQRAAGARCPRRA